MTLVLNKSTKLLLTGRFVVCLMKFFVISLPLQIIGLPIVGLIILCTPRAVSGNTRLPFFARWFDCADLYPEFNRNPITYIAVVLPKGSFYRWYWLCLRNPINYFSYKYLGVLPGTSIKPTAFYQNTDVYVPPGIIVSIGDSTDDFSGVQYTECIINNKIYYEVYIVRKYTSKFLQGKCFRMRYGWKLGTPTEIHAGEYVQDCFNLQLFATYSGR